MKMHSPISIMEETTCSERDLHRHCFLVLCLFPFLSLSHPPSVLRWPSPPSRSLSCSARLYSTCFCVFMFAGKSRPKSCHIPAMCAPRTEVNIWNTLMSPLQFCWCFHLISLQIHHRIPIFTPRRTRVLNWINVRLLRGHLWSCMLDCSYARL